MRARISTNVFIMQLRGGVNPILYFWSQSWKQIGIIFVAGAGNSFGMALYALGFQYTSVLTIVAIQFTSVAVTNLFQGDLKFDVLGLQNGVTVCMVVSLILMQPNNSTVGIICGFGARLIWDGAFVYKIRYYPLFEPRQFYPASF